ncbi:MAG: methyltransferase [Candidatus Methanogaster sp.]|uniref:Methyltransferase n=1 Tax=Candidatus Methanogaster sp. TaxID=3386292 RepID=A0AC61L323_9EURY|nr:MAG: methyltransferase [ANME-2 cluster archaeon]
MTDMIETIRNRANACRARVGIGIAGGTASKSVIADIESACGFADVVLIGDEKELSATGTDLEIIHSDNPEVELVDRLVGGRIDAAVRGTLGATKTLGCLKSVLGVSRLARLALLTTADGVPFFLVPVGIDEGNSVVDRVDLVSKSVNAIRRFGIMEKVAVLSGGRFEDAGRSEIVDQSLADGEVVTGMLCERGIDAKHYGILIEDAIRDANVIVAPDGITGNLIFRTLTFLGGGGGFGAPVLVDLVFVDTSRVKVKFSDAIMLASALVWDVDAEL